MLTHSYADVNGVRLHYAAAGRGKLLLFLHGFPEFWYLWRHQLAEFGRDHQAVAPDMRGYNLSSKPVGLEQYRMPVLIEDVRALVDHLGHTTFVLVGHDWGGAVAWQFALAYPERLDRLVIVNVPHPAMLERELRKNPAQRKASQYWQLFRSPQAEAALSADKYARLEQAVLVDGLKRGYLNEQDRAAYLEAWSQAGWLTGGLNYYRASDVRIPDTAPVPAPPDRPSVFVVRVPTLVIWGEQDAYFVPNNLDGLEEVVPRLTVRRVPDASHWIIHEKPAQVNAFIRGFLEE